MREGRGQSSRSCRVRTLPLFNDGAPSFSLALSPAPKGRLVSGSMARGSDRNSADGPSASRGYCEDCSHHPDGTHGLSRGDCQGRAIPCRMIPVSSRASNYSSMAAGHKSDRRHGRQFVRGARTHRDCRWNAGEAGANSRLLGQDSPWQRFTVLCCVQRIRAAHGLKLHRVKTFKLSNDPRFAAKVQMSSASIDPARPCTGALGR
jgi:hypothetical protein